MVSQCRDQRSPGHRRAQHQAPAPNGAAEGPGKAPIERSSRWPEETAEETNQGPGEQEVDELITEVRCEHFDLHSDSTGAAGSTGTTKKLEAT